MKAIAIQEFGRPEGMAVVDLPAPVPGAGQVLITTEAIGVGGVDALIRSGALASYGLFQEGHVPGSEVAGTVTAVGAGVDASWVGGAYGRSPARAAATSSRPSPPWTRSSPCPRNCPPPRR